MDYYFWFKAAHIIAVILFVSGLLLNGFLLFHRVPGDASANRLFTAARNWNRIAVEPALLLVWVLGLTLAYIGNHFTSPWLIIKMAIVFLLSGLHGAQSGTLRRLLQPGAPAVSPVLKQSAAITVALMAVVVMLVVLQPFF